MKKLKTTTSLLVTEAVNARLKSNSTVYKLIEIAKKKKKNTMIVRVTNEMSI